MIYRMEDFSTTLEMTLINNCFVPTKKIFKLYTLNYKLFIIFAL